MSTLLEASLEGLLSGTRSAWPGFHGEGLRILPSSPPGQPIATEVPGVPPSTLGGAKVDGALAHTDGVALPQGVSQAF